jgi:hypothetical protein
LTDERKTVALARKRGDPHGRRFGLRLNAKRWPDCIPKTRAAHPIFSPARLFRRAAAPVLYSKPEDRHER